METREEILGKLYALRAGMSYIAVKEGELKDATDYYNAYEKVAARGDEIKVETLEYDSEGYKSAFGVRLNDRISDRAQGRLRELLDIKRNIETYRWRVYETKQLIESRKKRCAEHSSDLRSIKRGIVLYSVFLGIAVAMLLWGILSIVSIANGWDWNGVFVGISVYAMLPIGAIAIFILLGKLIGANTDFKEARKYQANEAKELVRAQEELATYTSDVERLTRELEQYKKEQPALYEKYKKVKAEAIAKTYPLYMTLKGEEGAIVSECDWENLDLIIYYFETGRATTVKEALFLVDRQKQTEAIVNAVQDAGNLIAQTIATATVALMQTIKVACTAICNNIKAVSGHLATISAGISSIAGGVSSLVDAAELQNALLSQANRSSADIAADVAYMRLEFEQKRRREGR